MNICIYGASSPDIDKSYFAPVEALGRAMVQKGFGLVFGGGAQGLMGATVRGDYAAHCGTHQSLRAAAEDQTEAFLNHGAAERLHRREIAFIDIRAACPINANIHESKILSEDDRKIIADTAKKRKG